MRVTNQDQCPRISRKPRPSRGYTSSPSGKACRLNGDNATAAMTIRECPNLESPEIELPCKSNTDTDPLNSSTQRRVTHAYQWCTHPSSRLSISTLSNVDHLGVEAQTCTTTQGRPPSISWSFRPSHLASYIHCWSVSRLCLVSWYRGMHHNLSIAPSEFLVTIRVRRRLVRDQHLHRSLQSA
ncbi:uncharacterized protein BO87DRAFT_194566 [Aspergillus neoniger CBS 115656]|uniref:Uncharacterized protein n=1 Tax=Aspergillus neoniger (strain CBS 115656) TaxID=1448310 RepID=A0A318Y9A6_ASPNB|nr:hypothetical protein BO87DRAFT_194566 [Aspergillus neoniger CBS 115656]PYH29260.1 hypothetical protein BO87DRAFT_194566 [Aspergillus neoniger CBS 115656]